MDLIKTRDTVVFVDPATLHLCDYCKQSIELNQLHCLQTVELPLKSNIQTGQRHLTTRSFHGSGCIQAVTAPHLHGWNESITKRVLLPPGIVAGLQGQGWTVNNLILSKHTMKCSFLASYPETSSMTLYAASEDEELNPEIERRVLIGSFVMKIPIELSPFLPIRSLSFGYNQMKGFFQQLSTITLQSPNVKSSHDILELLTARFLKVWRSNHFTIKSRQSFANRNEVEISAWLVSTGKDSKDYTIVLLLHLSEAAMQDIYRRFETSFLQERGIAYETATWSSLAAKEWVEESKVVSDVSYTLVDVGGKDALQRAAHKWFFDLTHQEVPSLFAQTTELLVNEITNSLTKNIIVGEPLSVNRFQESVENRDNQSVRTFEYYCNSQPLNTYENNPTKVYYTVNPSKRVYAWSLVPPASLLSVIPIVYNDPTKLNETMTKQGFEERLSENASPEIFVSLSAHPSKDSTNGDKQKKKKDKKGGLMKGILQAIGNPF